jgi:hypothetical protein
MLLLRDNFVDMLKAHRQELPQIQGDDMLRRFRELIRPRMSDPSYPLGGVKITPPPIDIVKPRVTSVQWPNEFPAGVTLRDAFDPVFLHKYFGPNFNLGASKQDCIGHYNQAAAEAWALSAVKEGLDKYKAAVDDAITYALSIGESNIDDLTELVHAGFDPVVQRALPNLKKLDGSAQPPQQWIPDQDARRWVQSTPGVATQIAADDKVADAAFNVAIAVASLIPIAPVGTLVKTLFSITLNVGSASLAIADYCRGQNELKIANGGQSVTGADRFDLAKMNAVPGWSLVVNAVLGGAALAGDLSSAVSALSKSAALSRSSELISRLENGGAEALGRMTPADKSDLLVIFGDAEQQAALGKTLTTEQAAARAQGRRLVVLQDGCFGAGTLVEVPGDTRQPIEQIKPGDLVASRDPVTGRTAWKRVTRTTARLVSTVLTLAVAAAGGPPEIITTTPQHPFYVEGRGFVEAAQLGIGTSIVTRAGPALTVRSLEVSRTANATPVYNLEVEDSHTYFVGEYGLWVHNAACSDERLAQLLANKDYADDVMNRRGSFDPLTTKPAGWGGSDEAGFLYGDKAAAEDGYHWTLDQKGNLKYVSHEAGQPRRVYDSVTGTFQNAPEENVIAAKYVAGSDVTYVIPPSERDQMEQILAQRTKLIAERDKLELLEDAGTLDAQLADQLSKLRSNINESSRQLGENSATSYMRSQGASQVYPLNKTYSTSGDFDQVWTLVRPNGDTIYYVIEAKGGGSGLGTRLVGNSLRAEQGSSPYFNSIVSNMQEMDSSVQGIANDLQVAKVQGRVRYLKVRAPIGTQNGRPYLRDVSISQFDISQP